MLAENRKVWIVKKAIIILCSILIIFTFSSIGSGKIALWSLSDMVEKAETIVIGKVVRIDETNEKYDELTFYKVTIAIKKVLKGNQGTKSINVFFFPNIEDEPNFSSGNKSLFFIREYQGKSRLVQGLAGKIDIRNNEAKNIYMLRENRDQELDGFVKRIENLLHK